ncbi:MAG: TIGR03617 family F420-dependent LLM class oxidoreductase [Chloroflexi bacterium]|nr:TIGR03617 family F420-dependent LLM class oxidoreductase [Chloroflexota bacterium]
MKLETMVSTTDLRQAAEDAKRAEALGYDGVLTPETGHDPFFPLVVAGEHTTKLTLGTAVAIAFPRSPMVTAQMAWDLQKFTNGRFLLGLGTQVKSHNVRRYGAPWPSPPGPRLREYIVMLRAIWDSWQRGAKADFRGETYEYTLMTPVFNPGPIEHPHIPVYISAVNPYNCRLAGELCDGLRLHGFNTPKYVHEVIMPEVEKGAKKAGRSVKDLDIAGLGFVITGKNASELTKNAGPIRRQISFYASTPGYRAVMDIHGWSSVFERLFEMSKRGEWAAMSELITDDMLEQFCTIATYDELVPKLLKHYGGVTTRAAMALPARTPEEEGTARRIITELQSA